MIGDQNVRQATPEYSQNLRGLVDFFTARVVTMSILSDIARREYAEDPVLQRQASVQEELTREMRAWFEDNPFSRYEQDDNDAAVMTLLLTATTLVLNTLTITVTGVPDKVAGASAIAGAIYAAHTFDDPGKAEQAAILNEIRVTATTSLVVRDLTPEEEQLRAEGQALFDSRPEFREAVDTIMNGDFPVFDKSTLGQSEAKYGKYPKMN